MKYQLWKLPYSVNLESGHFEEKGSTSCDMIITPPDADPNGILWTDTPYADEYHNPKWERISRQEATRQYGRRIASAIYAFLKGEMEYLCQGRRMPCEEVTMETENGIKRMKGWYHINTFRRYA